MSVLRWTSQAWHDTSRGLRIATLVLWGAGIVLTTLGWIGDTTGFWQERGFLTNLVSSATGAMFGIPLALLVLQRISGEQASAEEARAAMKQAAKTAAAMEDALRELLQQPDTDPDRAFTPVLEGLRRIDALRHREREAYLAAVDHDEDGRPFTADEDAYREWRSIEEILDREHVEVRGLFRDTLDLARLAGAKDDLLSNWDHLVHHVQPAIRATGGRCLSRDRVRAFTARAGELDISDVIGDDMAQGLEELRWLLVETRSITDFFRT